MLVGYYRAAEGVPLEPNSHLPYGPQFADCVLVHVTPGYEGFVSTSLLEPGTVPDAQHFRLLTRVERDAMVRGELCLLYTSDAADDC